MPLLLSVLEIHPDLSCCLVCDRESRVYVKAMKITKLYASMPLLFLHVSLTYKPKGRAGEAEADAVHKSKPLQSIPKASSLIPLHQGHLGCKGVLSLVKPVLPRDITSHPPQNFESSRRLKLLAFMIG